MAPIFLIRAAGVPFDYLDKLATPQTAAAARQLLVRRREFEESATAVEVLLHTRGHGGLSEDLFRAWRRAIRTGRVPPRSDETSGAFATCWQCAQQQAEAEAALKKSMDEEIARARAALIASSRSVLPEYLLFGAPSVRGLFAQQLAGYPEDVSVLPPRNNAARKVEQSLLLYLQRVAAKNDTFSRFGPSAWGRTSNDVGGFRLTADVPIARREIFLERWTAHAVAAVMNSDDNVFAELIPRLSPDGIVDNQVFVCTATGATESLTKAELDVIRRCDGSTPAHAIGSLDVVRALVQRRILRCAIEVPALEPHAFEVIVGDVEKWSASAMRETWLSRLRPFAALRQRFSEAQTLESRGSVLEETRQRLETLGAGGQSNQRFLYAAANAIGEECVRESDFVIRDEMLQQVATEAAGWIDLWRDTYAFVASRVATGLRHILEASNDGRAALPLPAFVRACEIAKLPLTQTGLVELAATAFQEVKSAFVTRLRPQAARAEYELTLEDCHVVRNTFEYPKFDEYTYPSADLQIAAASAEAAAEGRYQWILSELHPPIALLHHGFYWSCPDKSLLNRSFVQTVARRPSFHFGFFAADFTAHTTVRIFDALGALMNFVSPQRGRAGWRCLRPAETEVYLDDSQDVCLRTRDSHEHLGSFARGWLIPLGFHPFYFGAAPHMPRLRCGPVVVQRQSWTITATEFLPGKISGVSANLVLAVERLRAEKGLPRHIYVRPTEQALRRSGAEGRDKDTKPVYIDLESYLSLEIFQRWLNKSGELEITEMLPDPEHLCWHESDGRHTFELRTLIVPRS